MSGKSVKSKKAKTVEEEVPLQATEDVLLEEPVKTKSSEKEKSNADEKAKAKKSTDEIIKGAAKNEIHWRTIDPIIKVSFVVFILACAIVIGNTIIDKTVADHSGAVVSYSDTVNVDYVGSYYCYYDETGAVIFDTSIADIGNDSDYTKSWSFSHSVYQPIKVNIKGTSSDDNGNYLTLFKESMIGHKVGETVKVKISPGDGYGALTAADIGTSSKTGVTVDVVYSTDASTFKTFFGVDAPEDGEKIIESPYGWDARVTSDSNGVKVQYIPEVDKTYEINDEVSVKVTSIENGVITYNYQFEFQKDENKMLKAVIDNEVVYIYNVNADGSEFTYKKTTELVGMDLYFTIKILSIVES